MKAITLSGEEKKVLSNGSTVVKIKDEKGLSYSFFMKKQDGTISKAYEGYQNFQLGDTVEIHFSEQQKEFEGKPYTLRNIAFFGDKCGSAPVETPRGEAPTASQGASGVNWDKLGLIKAYHNLIAAHLANGKDFEYVNAKIEDGTYWLLCKTVEADVTKRTATGWKKAEAVFKEDLPTI